jgi:dGTPase
VLKRFMYANLYHHPRQLAASAEALRIVTDLYTAYRAEPDLMGDSWSACCPAEEPGRSRHIADYIAGMTDRYAINAHRAIYGERTPEVLEG